MKRTLFSVAAAAAITVAVPAATIAPPAAAAAPQGVAAAVIEPRIKPDSVRVTAASPYRSGSIKHSKWWAKRYMKLKYGWGKSQYRALDQIFIHESGWQHRNINSESGAYGIPQALPAYKMSSVGKDWRTNPTTQIKWGLQYIKYRYGTPKKAWAIWQWKRWY